MSERKDPKLRLLEKVLVRVEDKIKLRKRELDEERQKLRASFAGEGEVYGNIRLFTVGLLSAYKIAYPSIEEISEMHQAKFPNQRLDWEHLIPNDGKVEVLTSQEYAEKILNQSYDEVRPAAVYVKRED